MKNVGLFTFYLFGECNDINFVYAKKINRNKLALRVSFDYFIIEKTNS